MDRYGDIRKLDFRGHPSRKFYVRVRRENGRTTWRCTGWADKTLAEAQVRAWQLDELRGHVAGTPAPAVASALREWLAVVTLGRSPNYVRCIDGFVRRFAPAFDRRTCDSITDRDIVAWASGRLAAGRAPTTVNLDLTLSRMFCAWCVDRGWLPRNPVSRRMRVMVPRLAPRTVTNAEEQRLLTAAADLGSRVYGYVLCLLTTGFRSGLAGRLRWEHVAAQVGMWRIPAKLMKSRREYVQPIPSCLMIWLTESMPDEPIGTIWGMGIRRWWYVVRERAGLPGLKQHDLRRTFVTRCRRARVPIEVTMALSDHCDVKTMLAVYRRVDECDTRQALARLEAQGGSYA